MWSLWKDSDDQSNVRLEMWKLGSWQMCECKKSYFRVAMRFACSRCRNMMDSIKKLCDGVKTVHDFVI